MVSAQARLEQARYAMVRGLSQRRACALLDVSRSGLSYGLKMPGKNAPVIAAMRTLSGHYPRFGSRRIQVMLGRDGIAVGKDRCASLWAKEGLQVPKRYGATTSYLTPAPMASS
jgi:putative transposase